MNWKQIIEDAGGYVHPDLILQVGAEAKHGKLSLTGVPSDVLSIRIPKSLGETTAGRGRLPKECVKEACQEGRCR